MVGVHATSRVAAGGSAVLACSTRHAMTELAANVSALVHSLDEQPEGLIELATTLNEPQTNIEGLSLRYLKISDEACAALADAMAENWTLARVELHGACPTTPTTPTPSLTKCTE